MLRTTFALAFLTLAADAQNCANTSVGLTPLNDLGTGTYQGFVGGLYPGGSNAMPTAHLVGGIREAAQVVPRDASGAPSASGRIVLLSIGMSNCAQEFQSLMALANVDPLRRPSVQLVQGAQGGQTASEIDDPSHPFWTVVDQRLAQAGATAQQVQVIWFKEADASPSSGFPAYAQTLRSEFTTILQILRSRFPNARLAYLASRIYAGYATGNLNPEPYAYEQGFACQWTIADQIGGSAALNYDPAAGPVVAPWIAWGTYNWADGTTPRSDGLTWVCADLSSDGTHPSAQGRDKVAQMTLAFLHTDPTAAAWYLRRPSPAVYGEAKLTSIGTLPSIGWTGTPSPAGAFAVTIDDALPNGVGIVFRGATADDVPFAGGTRWVAAPLTRLAVRTFDAGGGASWPVSVLASEVGTTVCYQGYVRDVAHPDGTGAGLSGALRVVRHD